MNKLEEYRNKFAHSKWAEGDIFPEYNMSASDMNDCIKQGFDAAIDLNLPVKFAEWLSSNGIKTDYKDKTGEIHWYKMELASHNHKGTTKELYQYWIDNIYKPE